MVPTMTPVSGSVFSHPGFNQGSYISFSSQNTLFLPHTGKAGTQVSLYLLWASRYFLTIVNSF